MVLCAQDDCVDADWFVSFVFDGDLALCVRAETGDEAFAACVCLLGDESVAELYWQGHECVGLAACESEHHALVARSFAVYALCDVLALFVECDHDGAGV